MSEPLSTTEIEDVLSSIRRLVAEDLRPHPHLHPQPPVQAIRTATGSSKLILTPALRIVTSDDTGPAASGVSAVISNLGTALTPSEWEPEAEEASDLDAPLSDEIEQDFADHGWAFDTDQGQGQDSAGVFLQPDPEPEPEPEPENAAAPAEGADEPVFVSVRRGGVADDLPGWAQSDEAEFAEAEEVLQQPATGTIEPDPEWADAAEADVLAELADDAAVEPSGYAGPAAFAAEEYEPAAYDNAEDDAADFDDEPHYDEALLREIVRDLLREELQGTTGERITRNIRKLVRAEIARALAVQDLI